MPTAHRRWPKRGRVEGGKPARKNPWGRARTRGVGLAELIVALLYIYIVEPMGVGKRGEGGQIFANLKYSPLQKKNRNQLSHPSGSILPQTLPISAIAIVS